jgi:hypothetical protein
MGGTNEQGYNLHRHHFVCNPIGFCLVGKGRAINLPFQPDRSLTPSHPNWMTAPIEIFMKYEVHRDSYEYFRVEER